ncbi:hypothetical protein ACB092_07G030200 [Castanea dentata]
MGSLKHDPAFSHQSLGQSISGRKRSYEFNNFRGVHIGNAIFANRLHHHQASYLILIKSSSQLSAIEMQDSGRNFTFGMSGFGKKEKGYHSSSRTRTYNKVKLLDHHFPYLSGSICCMLDNGIWQLEFC